MFARQVDLSCGAAAHLNRRTLLKVFGAGAGTWLTSVSELLARDQETQPKGKPPKSVIVLWLAGGPSQLETFDPHSSSLIGGETKAIKTAAAEIVVGSALEQTAEVMDSVAICRSVTSKEGDHERATYNAKTGFRPDPTLVHPAIGAVLCHQQPDNLEIPRHISILPDQWAARGGYLGDHYDAFKIYDPASRIPDVMARVDPQRFKDRLEDLTLVESVFSRRRFKNLDAQKTLHYEAMVAAERMMSSEQLKAFDISETPQTEREQYGDTSFGRGCLAALRLIESGVRCVEVTLGGWDSHVANHTIQMDRTAVLDPAYAALIRGLRTRGLLDSTIVICGGEFGRTPQINPAAGRDHWPYGFSIALAGGGIRGGVVYGETAAEPTLDSKKPLQDVAQPRDIADVHATVLQALGIEFTKELDTPVGRPLAISTGAVIKELLV
ncbi:MAG: DUF1501 domain-containing protein [Pirellulaceae bacterium]|nr:DUF1501 domain-containing protein [Pirellulaceae bacterium]